MFEKLEEVFDLVPASPVLDNSSNFPFVTNNQNHEQETFDDKKLAKETYRRMIRKSENMLDVLAQIAENTEHPRAFEVAANLVKTIADVAEKLSEASKNDDEKQQIQQQTTNINHNHLYVGSSEDLLRLIRNRTIKQETVD